MLHAHKANLQTNLRQRLLAIRERELDYYTDINRNIGNQAALIAGFAYSGIRYHYLVERQHSWQLSDGDSLEEVVFTSLLTMAMGCGLQTVLIAMLVAMLGPSLALRGGDGALHDAVKGMQAWTSAVLVLFLLSLFLLQARATSAPRKIHRARPHTADAPRHTRPCCAQLSALSFAFGHSQMGAVSSGAVSATVGLSLVATIRSTFFTLAKFRLPKEARRRAIRRNSAQLRAIRRNSAERRGRRARVSEASPRARASGGDHGRVPLR